MSKVKTLVGNVGAYVARFRSTIGVAATVAVATVAVPAHAVLSTEEQGVLDTITTKVTDYTGPALAVLGAVLGLFITIKWMKKIVSKVS